MNRPFQTTVLLVMATALPGVVDADTRPSPVPERIVIDLGTRDAAGRTGFGWSRPERDHERTFVWIKHMEADVWFDLAEVAPQEVLVTAAPLYIEHRRQNIGLYVNDRFVTEWVCANGPGFQDHAARIPAELLTAGRNRLTFRVGYRRQIGGDKRLLALAVDRIVLRPEAD